jgi:hypothetical protein
MFPPVDSNVRNAETLSEFDLCQPKRLPQATDAGGQVKNRESIHAMSLSSLATLSTPEWMSAKARSGMFALQTDRTCRNRILVIATNRTIHAMLSLSNMMMKDGREQR